MGGHGVWSYLEWLWYVATGLLAVPCVIVCCQAQLAHLARLARRPLAVRPAAVPLEPEMRITVVIPAHDEELTLGDTLRRLRAEAAGHAKIVVVADHCADRTPEIARDHGVCVVERQGEPLRGKGHALAAGIESLRADPPDVVVFLDADCHFDTHSLLTLAQAAHETQTPMQAVYWLDVPPNPSARAQVSAFAFRFKNEVRARGMAALGLPVHLTGSGMAFPWHVAARAPFASSCIVEDLELGIRLALAGAPAHLCANAVVRGQLPGREADAEQQRRRWEHGYLQTLFRYVPRLLLEGVRRQDVGLLALGLDLGVPPLTSLQLLLIANLLSTMAACVFGLLSVTAPALTAAAEVTLLWAVWRGWRFLHPAQQAPTSWRALLSYWAWKMPIAWSFWTQRQRAWVRTARTPSSVSHPERLEFDRQNQGKDQIP